MGRIERVSALIALTTLALTWPLLELLGNNAEFFLWRRAPRGDVILLAVLVGLALPALLGLLGLIPGPAGRLLWTGAALVLATLLARLILRGLPIPDAAITGMAAATGVALVAVIQRTPWLQSLLKLLAVTPIVTTTLFLFATPTGAIIRHSGAVVGTSITPAHPRPIVIIGFDEFPVASLIRPDGSLKTDIYPNFAALAEDATWFRNAVGVEQQTEQAFPAILTGVIPPGDLPPFAADYPNTIFSLLGRSYDMTVIEAITQLCPETVCGHPGPGAGYRLSTMMEDTSVVAGHLALPEALAEDLPPIDGRWGSFGIEEDNEEFSAVSAFREEMEDDRRGAVADLVAAIHASSDTARPFLGFLHILVPHHPWQYLPTGQAYPTIGEGSPGTTKTGWGDDQWLLDQAIQRHLLQVGYADHALGEIVTALKKEGIYDEAIVVVVADHGIAVKPNVAHQRVVTEETIGNIAAIPLFIKGPGLEGGVIDDRRAETIDILPTILEMLGVPSPYPMDGLSLLGEIDREESTMHSPQGSVTFGVSGEEKLAVAADIARAFPTGDPYELRPPDAADLRGLPIPATASSSRRTAALDRPEWYREVDLDGSFIPTRITGRLDQQARGDEVVGVAINGVIRAVVRAYVDKNGVVRFQAMVPPESLVEGDNRIALVEVSDDGLLSIDASGG